MSGLTFMRCAYFDQSGQPRSRFLAQSMGNEELRSIRNRKFRYSLRRASSCVQRGSALWRVLLRLLTAMVSGGTPRLVSCPSQDQETLAPDIFCCVDVGVCRVSATHAPEDRLTRSVAGSDVPTRRATLAGVGSRYSDKLTLVPVCFVLDLVTESVPALGKD